MHSLLSRRIATLPLWFCTSRSEVQKYLVLAPAKRRRLLWMHALQFLDLDKIGQKIVVESASGQTDAIAKPVAPTKVPPAKLRQDARLVSLLQNAVEAAKGDDGWALLSLVRNHISNRASFDPRNYGYATFSKLISATELFEMAGEGTPRVSIRDVRKEKAGKST